MYIAIDIGGTKTLIAAFSDSGEILRSEKFPTSPLFHNFTEKLIATVERIAEGDVIDAIAVAAPAFIEKDTGIAKEFGNLEWENVDIISPLKEAFVQNVYIENDAKMGALGEANLGAGKGYETVLYITLSTGIGAGVTHNGELVEALEHMEGGHMVFMHEGKPTIWERFASGKAFYEEFGMKGEDDENPDHWKAWADDVALGLYDLIAVIQPEAVIIGGSMGNHYHKYHDFLHAAIQNRRSPMVEMPAIHAAQNPDNAVINGCFVLCQHHSKA